MEGGRKTKDGGRTAEDEVWRDRERKSGTDLQKLNILYLIIYIYIYIKIIMF